MSSKRANILVQLSTIVLLLVKALRFVIQTTLECRGQQKTEKQNQVSQTTRILAQHGPTRIGCLAAKKNSPTNISISLTTKI